RHTPQRSAPALVPLAGVRGAQRYARARQGGVAFAEVGRDGRLRGLRTTVRFPSASVVKAMLLVAALRSAGLRPLTMTERRLLGPMIRVSDNEAAEAVF